MAHSKAILMNRVCLIRKMNPDGKTSVLLERLLANIGVIIVSGIILAGCHLNGLQPVKQRKDQPLLNRAEQAFLDEDYQTSRRIYRSVMETRTNPDIKASARYGLFCADMADAKKPDAFRNTVASFMKHDVKTKNLKINPELMARGIAHGLALMEARQKKTEAEIVELRRMGKKYKAENQKMQQLINTLRHQISVLESIEQERRKKRKTQ